VAEIGKVTVETGRNVEYVNLVLISLINSRVSSKCIPSGCFSSAEIRKLNNKVLSDQLTGTV
jgi:hypothetical protein